MNDENLNSGCELSTKFDAMGEGTRRQANWFYFIAFLSFLGSLTFLLNSNLGFTLGAGILKLSSGYITPFVENNWLCGFVGNITIALLYAFLAYHSFRFAKWAYISGLTLYFIDTLSVLYLNDWYNSLFHLFVLTMVVRGFIYLLRFERLVIEEEMGL